MVKLYDSERRCMYYVNKMYEKGNKHLERSASIGAQLGRDKESALQVLREARKGKRLCLFLGAGVSLSAGFPSWNTLVRRLAEYTLFQDIGDSGGEEIINNSPFLTSTLPILARVMKDLTPQELFLKQLHNFLYPSQSASRTSSLIEAVCKLTADEGRIHVKDIVTYNYDDLIERNLQRSGIPCTSIFGPGQKPDDDKVNVYHVHGFLPEEDFNNMPLNQIILSEEEYNSILSDDKFWSNTVQQEKLSSSTCLLVGLSLQDPNLRRVLDTAKKNKEQVDRYVIFTPGDVFQGDLPRLSKEGGSPNDERLNSNRNAYLPVYRKSLVSRATESIGVKCIWLEEHSQIPGFLDMVKDDQN